MTKDRLHDLRNNSITATVAYTKLPQELGNPHDRNVNGHCTKITIDNQCDITDCLKEIDTTQLTMDRLDELVEQVKQMHVGMLEPRPDPTLPNELNKKKEEIRKLAFQTSSTLKRMEHEETIGNDHSINNAQYRIRKSQVYVLTRHFRDTMIEYNRETVLQRERCKKIIERELQMSGNRRTDQELEEFLENGCPGNLNLGLLVDVQNAQQTLDQIEARHLHITNLETSIEKLHDMYIDLAILVAEQGEMVDSIEHHVAKSDGYVELAVVDVRKARESRMASLNMKAIMAIIALTSVVLTLFIGYVAYLIWKKI